MFLFFIGENAQDVTSISRILNTVFNIDRKLDSLTAINRKLDSILAFHDAQNPLLPSCFLDLLPDFPLSSIEVFHKFCTDLNENEEIRKQFVSFK